MRVSQDRLTEKAFLQELGLKTAPFADIADLTSLNAAIEQIGTPAILKTRRFGYDGKGQARLRSPEDAEAALADMAGAPAILEGFVGFLARVSIIAARGLDGQVACFDPGENVHRDGILRTTTIPARLSPAQRTDAILLAANILNALEYVGVMALSCLCDARRSDRERNRAACPQFGPLDAERLRCRSVRTAYPRRGRLAFGGRTAPFRCGDGKPDRDDMDRVPELARERDVALHLYGKAEVKAGRKMGHFTASNVDET